MNEPGDWGMIRAKVSMGDSCQIALSFRDYSDTAYAIRTTVRIFQFIAQGPFVLPLILLQWGGNMGGNSHSPITWEVIATHPNRTQASPALEGLGEVTMPHLSF